MSHFSTPHGSNVPYPSDPDSSSRFVAMGNPSSQPDDERLDVAEVRSLLDWQRAERDVTSGKPPEPPDRDRLFTALGEETQTPADTKVDIVRQGDGEWLPTGFEGVEARVLALDETAQRRTLIVRMAAGSRYPSHKHAGPEECYVLSGDVRSGDVVLRQGDYQRAAEDSIHEELWTEEGCTLLIQGSLSDALI